jgi:hypothetical protein
MMIKILTKLSRTTTVLPFFWIGKDLKPHVTARCETIKIAPCSKPVGVKHGPKFWSPSYAMATLPYRYDILEENIKEFKLNP